MGGEHDEPEIKARVREPNGEIRVDDDDDGKWHYATGTALLVSATILDFSAVQRERERFAPETRICCWLLTQIWRLHDYVYAVQ